MQVIRFSVPSEAFKGATVSSFIGPAPGNATDWIKQAVPKPDRKSVHVQLGVHFEEVGEMIPAMTVGHSSNPFKNLWYKAKFWTLGKLLDSVGANFKRGDLEIETVNTIDLLDSLCDQRVTGECSAYMMGMNLHGAYNEVNHSNFSKFVDGKPVFDANGKIAKGPDYRKPTLLPYVNRFSWSL